MRGKKAKKIRAQAGVRHVRQAKPRIIHEQVSQSPTMKDQRWLGKVPKMAAKLKRRRNG